MIAFDDSKLRLAVDWLLCGKALIVKTDTVWGLLSINENLLYEIKKRPITKPFVRLINDINVMHNLKKIHKDFIKEFWPGDVTIIKDNISYRMPHNDFLLKLTNFFPATTPLFLTSANISGEETIKNYKDAATVFNEWCDWCAFVVPSKEPIDKFKKILPSSIVDIDKWKILRAGDSEKRIILWIYNNVIVIDKLNKINNRITRSIEINKDCWCYTQQLEWFENHESKNWKKPDKSNNFFINWFRKKGDK